MRSDSQQLLDANVTEVGKRSIQGVFLQFASGAMALVSIILLARLLEPSDFGIVATLAPLVAFVQMFKRLGLTAAIVQAEMLDENEVSVYFWLQLILGALLGSGLALIGPLWADFMVDPRLKSLAIAMGAIAFIETVGGIHDALLRRNLLFGRLSSIQILGLSIGLVAALAAYVAGLGYWSLVVQQATNSVVVAIGMWLLCPWRPNIPRKMEFEKLKGIVLGGSLTISQICEYIRRNSDLFMIRLYAGEEQLGYYSNGYRLVMTPTSQIMRPLMSVTLPMLSRKRDSDEYQSCFESVFLFCIVAAVPAGVFTLLFPESVVSLGLGTKWTEAVPIVRGLGILSLVIPIGNCLSVNLIVYRKTRAILMVSVIALVVVLAAFYLGIQHSVVTLIHYYAATMTAFVTFYIVYVTRISPISGIRLLKIAIPPLGMMFACGLTVLIGDKFLELEPGQFSIAIANFIAFVVLYGLSLFVTGYGSHAMRLLRRKDG
ncbi:MAG: oligosaccharide flippase family protein [Planctomycetota bacterium]